MEEPEARVPPSPQSFALAASSSSEESGPDESSSFSSSCCCCTGRYEPNESMQTGFRMDRASSRMDRARLNLIQTQITRKEHIVLSVTTRLKPRRPERTTFHSGTERSDLPIRRSNRPSSSRLPRCLAATNILQRQFNGKYSRCSLLI